MMRTTTRVIAALAVWAAGAVHLYLWDAQDYRAIPTIGTLFLLNGIAAGLIGLALLATANPLVLLAGIGYAATTLIAFAISATSGLFGWTETWAGSAQEAAGAAELVALGLLLALLAGRLGALGRTRSLPPRPRKGLIPRT
jgi:hypothetical protein